MGETQNSPTKLNRGGLCLLSGTPQPLKKACFMAHPPQVVKSEEFRNTKKKTSNSNKKTHTAFVKKPKCEVSGFTTLALLLSKERWVGLVF